jgi:hypothetical protein
VDSVDEARLKPIVQALRDYAIATKLADPPRPIPALSREILDEKDFDAEITAWCSALRDYPGEINPGIVHYLIKERREAFKEAVVHGIAFNLLDISLRISKAAKYLVHEKEVAFSIVANLPHPDSLAQADLKILGQLVDAVEQEYGGVVVRLARKWGKTDSQLRKTLQLPEAPAAREPLVAPIPGGGGGFF